MPAVGRFSGTPASIRASDEPQTVAIEEEPFELGDLRDDADGVGEFRRGRQHRANRAPRELSVADLPPARRAHPTRLADGVGREVVVEQEALFVGTLERVDVLLVLTRAKGCDNEGLCFPASEERGAMRAREDANLGENRTHGRQVASIDPAVLIEDVPAHDFRLRVVESFGDLGRRKLGLSSCRRKRGGDLCLRRVDSGVPLLLLGDRIGGAQIGFGDLEHRLLDRRAIAWRQFARFLGGLFSEADDGLDDRLEAGVAGHDRLQHRLLGQLLGFRFDHQDRIRRTRDDKVQRGILHLLDCRIDPNLTLDHADASGADRAHERNPGKGQSRR